MIAQRLQGLVVNRAGNAEREVHVSGQHTDYQARLTTEARCVGQSICGGQIQDLRAARRLHLNSAQGQRYSAREPVQRDN